MLSLIHNIKTYFRNSPSMSSIFKKILVEVSNMILVMLIHLSDTFSLNYFMKVASINLSIECKFDWVYNIFIELSEINKTLILFNRISNMIENICIRDET